MPNNTFTIIAVQCTKDASIGQRKLIAGNPYHFISGCEVECLNISLKINDNRLLEGDDLYSRTLDKQTMGLSISAIVGDNGSGKSTIIEFIIRLINNFAAILIGEDFVSPMAEHLHFIDNVFGRLYFIYDGCPYCLDVDGYMVTLNKLVNAPDGENLYIIGEVFYRSSKNYQYAEARKSKIASPILDSPEYIAIANTLRNFFYTIVLNYSSYAYNTLDYVDEATTAPVEAAIRGISQTKVTQDNASWLKGLFHKNDGYQTPIVLTPMRTKGNIDVNTEKELATDRLILMLIWAKSFKEVNRHLKLQSIECQIKDYSVKAIKSKLGMQFNEEGWKRLSNFVLDEWETLLSMQLRQSVDNKHLQDVALRYLVYKTLKISQSYIQYKGFWEKNAKKRYAFDEKAVRLLVQRIYKDQSHVTAKLRRTIAYLNMTLYDHIGNYKEPLDVDKLSDSIEKLAPKLPLANGYVSNTDDLLPPPFLHTEVWFTDKPTGVKVPLTALSSGERQIAHSISAILYHLKNLESVRDDANKKRVCYKKAFIVLEEVELYYHPEMQQHLVSYLIDGINQLELKYINGIHILIVTHSPFILSDIPSRNILSLQLEEKEHESLQTFGANIHDILGTSFFLHNGAIGDYSRKIITDICNEFHAINNNKKEQVDKEQLLSDINLIEEPIIKQTFLDEYYRSFPEAIDKKQLEIENLERRLDYLKRLE